MSEEIILSKKEREFIESFDKKINDLIIGNDDKIYLRYFSNSLLSNNFIGATSIGFVFIEKLLRTELVLHKVKKESTGGDNFLYLLDSIEESIEDGEGVGGKTKGAFDKLRILLESYGINSKVSKEALDKSLTDYIEAVNIHGVMPKAGYSFNNICQELAKEGLLEKEFSKELKSFYAKYRNAIQHGLFKRLFNIYFNKETMPVVTGNIETGKITTLTPQKTNLLFRQFALEDIFKHVSLETFELIRQILKIFNK